MTVELTLEKNRMIKISEWKEFLENHQWGIIGLESRVVKLRRKIGNNVLNSSSDQDEPGWYRSE